MTTATKKKLCWNCEGRVNFEEEHCPFCGVYLSPTPLQGAHAVQEEELYSPPYSLNQNSENHVPPPPYGQHQQEAPEPSQEEEEGEEASEGMRDVLIPLAALLGGSVFFLFGIVLYLFSDEGMFTLKWSGDYWYLYFGAGALLLLFGWKALQYLDDE